MKVDEDWHLPVCKCYWSMFQGFPEPMRCNNTLIILLQQTPKASTPFQIVIMPCKQQHHHLERLKNLVTSQIPAPLDSLTKKTSQKCKAQVEFELKFS
jgi:hypothetical protein